MENTEDYNKLLYTIPDQSKRTKYSYYRKEYENPTIGDIIVLHHYSDDYNTVWLVIEIIKNGVYKVVPLRNKQTHYSHSQLYNTPGLSNRSALEVIPSVTPSIISIHKLTKTTDFLFMTIGPVVVPKTSQSPKKPSISPKRPKSPEKKISKSLNVDDIMRLLSQMNIKFEKEELIKEFNSL